MPLFPSSAVATPKGKKKEASSFYYNYYHHNILLRGPDSASLQYSNHQDRITYLGIHGVGSGTEHREVAEVSEPGHERHIRRSAVRSVCGVGIQPHCAEPTRFIHASSTTRERMQSEHSLRVEFLLFLSGPSRWFICPDLTLSV